MINELKIWMLTLAFLLLFSCDSNRVYEKYIEVENQHWLIGNTARFEFEATDTLNPHNLYINIRNAGTYSYSNLYLFVTLQGPQGGVIKDTVNCQLADKSGRWLGNGVGDLWDLRVPYMGGFKFAQKGNYTITLAQAMRVEEGLKGITDVGLRIEKSN